MRELLILSVIIACVVFFAPVIISVIIFSLAAAAVVMILRRFGILPGIYIGRRGRGRRAGWKYTGGAERKEKSAEWYDASQEGEEIILPETALRKEHNQKKK